MAMTPLPPAPSRASPSDFAAKGDAFLLALPGFVTEANALQADVTNKQAATAGYAAQRDATGGYPGLTLFKINFKNALNTFTSFLTNANTAARTYTFPDADITVAGIASPAFTGVPTVPTAADGTNTVQAASTAFVQAAVGGYLNLVITTGLATRTLSDLEASNPMLEVSGLLTVNVAIVIPATTKRLWSIVNTTTGAFTVTVKTAAGAGVGVAQGKRNLVYTDGINVYDAFNDFESVALTGLPTAPTAAIGTNTTQIASTAFVTGQKDATGGIAGLTLFKINFKNALNTFTSFFTNANTAARTYTFQDKTGTIADLADLALKADLASPVFTGSINVSGVVVGRGGSGNSDCVAIGPGALNINTTAGIASTAVGSGALASNVSGQYNLALGYSTLGACTGSYNAGLGTASLTSNTSGNNNTAVGCTALNSLVTYSNCVGLGSASQVTASNQVQLGDSSTTTYVYGTIQNRSDLRDKADVRDTLLGLDFVNALRPVDYRWDMRDDYRPPMPVATGQLRPSAPMEPDRADADAVASYAQAQEVYLSELAAFEAAQADYQSRLSAWQIACRSENITRDGSKKRKRFHHGLIAQEVRDVIRSSGVDFGGLQDHESCGGQGVLSIGYDELIAPLIKAVQELSYENKQLALRVEALESV
ncbi:MAG: tail fiber domain-containing protein [Polaromonas sp.]|nr:tail fiber domain-containing protein [Polaromonas sp.]